MEWFVIIVMFVATVGLIAGIIFLRHLAARHRNAVWGGFAEKMGLSFRGGGAFGNQVIEGLLGDTRIFIQTEEYSSGKSSRKYTRYRAFFNAGLPRELNVSDEGIGDDVAKLFGGQDIQLGDDSLDGLLRIKGADEDEVRRFLGHPAIRQAVLELLEMPQAVVSSSDASFLVPGATDSPQALVGYLGVALDCVRTIEEALAERDAAPDDRPVRETREPEVAVEEATDTSSEDPGPAAEHTETATSGEPTPEEAGEPAGSGPQEAPVDPDVLAPLGDDSTSREERQEIFESVRGRRIEATCTIAQVAWTTSLDVSARVRGGQTAEGRLASGVAVGVAHPRERDAEIRALRRGDVHEFRGIIVHLDPLFGRLIVEAD